jgi:hypothetical protein
LFTLTTDGIVEIDPHMAEWRKGHSDDWKSPQYLIITNIDHDCE